jgi:hypothetical protein
VTGFTVANCPLIAGTCCGYAVGSYVTGG